MKRHSTFAIPDKPEQSTDEVRQAYRATYGRQWPGDDATLRKLASSLPSEDHYVRERAQRDGGATKEALAAQANLLRCQRLLRAMFEVR